MSEQITIVIDATKGIVGRIASYAAKQAMLGKKVVIVNCDHAVVSGTHNNIVDEYNTLRRKGGSSMNGPFFPKNPERLMKRTVRGMLAYTQQRGRDALERVMCYNAVPLEFANSKKITIVKELKTKSMTLAELEKII